MARNLQVYPKASIKGNVWTFTVKVHDRDTGTTSRFRHIVPAGVTLTGDPLRLLKVAFRLTVDDTDTDQDVDDSLFADDIIPGGQTGTVWSEWQDQAETIIAGLSPGYTVLDFWADWGPSDTAQVRQDARRALITQRGWTVVPGSVHQHEGDGTELNE